MAQNQHAAIVSAYERTVQPHMARGDNKAAAPAIQALVNRYGGQAVEEALESLVMHYDLKNL
ncbi:hypothetical protein GCM10010317_077270 [Streptomyces mirabilis]|uniref:hypothetical protein n=1 Tax=Streptomyces mirabilis TaxID=68239 RepID=UPI00167DF727|nr:hypothetical protein [Streptomyces mirabilis]GHD70281.1 hypothetical protein GCM10010317_077270 [Streptomyces mirabilis]